MSTQRQAGKRPSHKWALDFSPRSRSDRCVIPYTPSEELAFPIGYMDRLLPDIAVKDTETDLVVKRSWDIALGPIKQIPMNLFIMWMAGNTISIFPIMMVGMMFIRPIQAIIAAQATFKMIEGSHALPQRFVYLLGNLAGLALALYKCQVMGLLPTYASDWLAFVEPQLRMEWSGGGLAL